MEVVTTGDSVWGVFVEGGVDPLVGCRVVAGVEQDVEAGVPDDLHDICIDGAGLCPNFGALIPGGDSPPVLAIEGVEVLFQLWGIGALIVGRHPVAGAETAPYGVAEADDLTELQGRIGAASQADLHVIGSKVRQAEHRDGAEVNPAATGEIDFGDTLLHALEHVLHYPGGLHRLALRPGDLLGFGNGKTDTLTEAGERLGVVSTPLLIDSGEE